MGEERPMAQHVWVNPERLEKAQKTQKVDGVELIIELSPYETPRAVIGESEKGRFIIRFRYIDEEPSRPHPITHEGIEFWVGLHSGKILRISIPIDTPPLAEVAVIRLRTKVIDALENKRETLKAAIPRASGLNVDVAEEILSAENFAKLAKDLTGSH
jgi:hypothetical protein